jgi:hypothetical protein
MQMASVSNDKNKFWECISPMKLMITAPINIGNCAIIAHLVSNPKTIKIPPKIGA